MSLPLFQGVVATGCKRGPLGRRTNNPPGLRPDTVRDNRSDYEAHEGRMQTGRRTEYAGSKLKPPTTWEGAAWKASLAAVLGKTRRTE